MSDRRRSVGALVVALVAMGSAGCAASGPLPSCGEYTLDQGDSIPQEAVDCMSAAGEEGALRVTVPTIEDDPIITTYYNQRDGEILVTDEMTMYNGVTFMKLCHDPVSVVNLGQCEELHEGD